jgi:hypothetical protein
LFNTELGNTIPSSINNAAGPQAAILRPSDRT